MSENTEGFSRGTLVRGIGSFYTARDPDGNEFTLRCKKKFRHLGMSPMTGDEVLFTKGEGEAHGWIEEILPRKTVCLRPPVANVERLVLVISPVPEPDMLLADRQISRAFAQGMEVIIAVNKSDLDSGLADRIREQYAEAGIPVYRVSAREKAGLEELKEAVRNGFCIAVYRSKSRYEPMDRKKHRGPLPDGTWVLMCDKAKFPRLNSPDRENNPLLGIIFRSNTGTESYYRFFLFFNEEDLTLVY